jgi:hypothetical protein
MVGSKTNGEPRNRQVDTAFSVAKRVFELRALTMSGALIIAMNFLVMPTITRLLSRFSRAMSAGSACISPPGSWRLRGHRRS